MAVVCRRYTYAVNPDKGAIATVGGPMGSSMYCVPEVRV